MTEHERAAHADAPIDPDLDMTPTPPATRLSVRERQGRLGELMGLLSLIAVAATVYVVTGPEAFAAVTAVGSGLFATWSGPRMRE
ncbi:hypothetical protein [Streptomyces sp. b84]|uniref:hypothetical protein n=1 Tax=Streptomyces sp. b84 TaxID=1827631 RepID=UPI000BEFA0D3|nr:hypothetical protein [Streptomyces sp. b84]